MNFNVVVRRADTENIMYSLTFADRLGVSEKDYKDEALKSGRCTPVVHTSCIWKLKRVRPIYEDLLRQGNMENLSPCCRVGCLQTDTWLQLSSLSPLPQKWSKLKYDDGYCKRGLRHYRWWLYEPMPFAEHPHTAFHERWSYQRGLRSRWSFSVTEFIPQTAQLGMLRFHWVPLWVSNQSQGVLIRVQRRRVMVQTQILSVYSGLGTGVRTECIRELWSKSGFLKNLHTSIQFRKMMLKEYATVSEGKRRSRQMVQQMEQVDWSIHPILHAATAVYWRKSWAFLLDLSHGTETRSTTQQYSHLLRTSLSASLKPFSSKCRACRQLGAARNDAFIWPFLNHHQYRKFSILKRPCDTMMFDTTESYSPPMHWELQLFTMQCYTCCKVYFMSLLVSISLDVLLQCIVKNLPWKDSLAQGTSLSII